MTRRHARRSTSSISSLMTQPSICDLLDEVTDYLYVLRVGGSMVEIGCSYDVPELVAFLQETCNQPVVVARTWKGQGRLLQEVMNYFAHFRAPYDCRRDRESGDNLFCTDASVVIAYVDGLLRNS